MNAKAYGNRTDPNNAYAPWTQAWCERKKRLRELKRMKEESRLPSKPEKAVGPVYWDHDTRDAQEEAIAAYYDDEMWERPLPERIPAPLINFTEAALIHKARLEAERSDT